MQRSGRLGHVVDIDRLPRHVLVRGIMALVGGHAAGDPVGLEVRGGVLVHPAFLTPPLAWISAPARSSPLVSAKNRRSRLRAASARYSAEARMSVSGVKSAA